MQRVDQPTGTAQPRSETPVAIPALLFGLAALTFAPDAAAQWRQRERYDASGSDESLFSIPRSQDDIHSVKLADKEIKDGAFQSAVERLHHLLEKGRKGLFPNGKGRYLGMRAAVIGRMRQLPKEATAAYEKLVQREAGDLLRSAFVGRNFEGLRALADRFPTAQKGRAARLRLGDLWLEAGRSREAISCYNRLLTTLDPADARRRLVRERLSVAYTLATEQSHGERGKEILDLSDRMPSSIGWGMYGGGGDGTRHMKRPTRLGGEPFQFQLSSPGYGSFSPLTLHPIGGLSGLYFNTGHKVVAIDPVGGRKRWEAPGPLVGSHEASEYFDTLSQQMLLSTAVTEDVVVAHLQVPNDQQARSHWQLELLYKLPTRRLFAFDRHTGKRLWAHWDYEGGPRSKRFESHNAPAPPIIDGDTVYASTTDPHGAISYYLSAYDLKTGEPKWRTLICSSQGEVNMFGNAKIEYAATPPALHKGMLYGTTNLGLCYAADAVTGRVRWCSTYPIIRLPPTRLRGQAVRPVFFGNNPVVVSGDVMLCTPLDSENVLAFDIATGRLLWKLNWRNQANHQNNIKWLLGVNNGEVILSGAGVIAAKLRATGRTGVAPKVRQIRLPDYSSPSQLLGRGALSGNEVQFPTHAGLFTFDRSGNATAANFRIKEPGNLLLVDGMAVSVRANVVQVYIDQEGLADLARADIRKDPDNPAHYLRLAMLLRGGEKGAALRGSRGDRIVKLLRQGIAAAQKSGLSEGNALLNNLSAELFKISLRQATAALSSSDTRRALSILARARDESGDANRWITAQVRILEFLAGNKQRALAEYERLADAHGDHWFRFGTDGRMQVKPFTLWKRIPYLDDPAAIVTTCQALLEEYPDVALGKDTARAFATRTIQRQIQTAGREVYATVEARAQKALTAAGGDVTLLRRIDNRFPHSQAAAKARGLVLDQAVLRGDLATAAAMATRSLRIAPGMLRRLMIAAQKAGNLPLARAIGEQLLHEHGDAVSDFGPDKGQKFQAVVKLPALPQDKPRRPDVPARKLELAITYAEDSQLEILGSTVVDGFPRPKRNLLYIAAGIDRLLGYDLAKSFTTPAFSVPAELRLHILNSDERLLVCGERLLINEGHRLRALHAQTGEELWKQSAGDQRSFHVLGVQSGVLQAFSTLSDHGDGGQIVGYDALSGARLYRHVFPASRETIFPRAFVGDLWTLHVPRGKTHVEVHRIHGLTGNARHQFKIPGGTQRKLGLQPRRGDDIRIRHAQSGLLVDESRIYICAGDTRDKPVVAAFDHTGQQKWVWESPTPRASLKLHTLHATGLVLLEVGLNVREATSRIVVLDKQRGKELRGTRMRGSARVLTQHHTPRAPDTLLFELNDDTTSLVCYSLTGKGPSFRYNTNQRRVFWRYPMIGDGFLAAPVLDTSGIRMELLVLDTSTRRGALPGGKKSRRLPDRGTGYKVVAHDRYVLCQTRESILVYGKGGK